MKDRIVRARDDSPSKIKDEAAVWRQAIRDAYSRDDSDLAETLELLVSDEAEKIEQKNGPRAAKAFHDAATSVEPTLNEAAEDWLNATRTKASTELKRRKAYEDLRDFLGADIPPKALTDVQVRDYVDLLKRSELAPNTIRDKLSALAGLWGYMAERLIIPKGTNPWRGFTIQAGSTEACRAFTQAEILTMLSAKYPQSWHRDVFICLLLTGARPQELYGLTHADVDLSEKYISIASSKTSAGIRKLPIEHPVLLSLLAGYVCSGSICTNTLISGLFTYGGVYDGCTQSAEGV